MNFRFDPETHTYYGDDKPMPSVTQVLKSTGCMAGYRGTAARDRGTRIHEATEIFDALGIYPDEEELIPYIKAWAKFIEDSKAIVLQSEKSVYHESLWYAGTLDRVMLIDHKRAIVDIKSGTAADWHRIQLGGYNLALDQRAEIGVDVYLKSSGRPTIRMFSEDHLKAAEEQFKLIRRNYHEQ